MHSLTFVIKAAKTEWGASLMPASAPYPILWVNQRSISWTGLFSQVPFFTSVVELYSSRANCSLQEQADCHKTNTICTILPLDSSSLLLCLNCARRRRQRFAPCKGRVGVWQSPSAHGGESCVCSCGLFLPFNCIKSPVMSWLCH